MTGRKQSNYTSVHEYTILSSALSEVMRRQDILGKDIPMLQDIFANSLIEVFKISLDVNIDLAQFDEFLSGCGSQPNDREVVEFIMDVTENDKTYAIVTYFLLFYLFTIYESRGEEERAELEDLFIKYGIEDQFTERVIRNFQRIANVEYEL